MMRKEDDANVVPLFGRDEMNLIEFPFGPISSTKAKTMEVEHQVFDRRLRREVTRRMIITGADKFGLPRPIDDQVLVGMKTLTHEAGFVSPQVKFSRYQLCRIIGWEPDGRSYARLEESFDRIAGTTLKFKDAWYDKGEKEFKSKTFHLITEVDLCSRDQLDRNRRASGKAAQKLCSFTWTAVVWKSFQDGFIKTLDMTMFRRIARGRRREVPLRLFRILDKRFWHRPVAEFNLRRLCIGTLGLCPTYSPAQMARILDRAAKWLVECGYLADIWYGGPGSNQLVYFRRRCSDTGKKANRPRIVARRLISVETSLEPPAVDNLKLWIAELPVEGLADLESRALESGFGSELERKIIREEQARGVGAHQGGRIRQELLRRFIESRGHRIAASRDRRLIAVRSNAG